MIVFDDSGSSRDRIHPDRRVAHQREDPDLSPETPIFAMLDHPGIGAWPVPAPALGQHTEEILSEVAARSGTRDAA